MKKRLMQQAISLMYFKVRIFNPDGLLTALEPIFRPVLNRWGFMAWIGLVLFTLFSLVPQWSRLVSGADSVTAPTAWPYMISVYILLKLWHEFGHGVICKRFGGQVPELGAMLLVLIPSPYVDASSAWSFPSKWRRMAVGMGGMFFELTAAAVAAQVWLNTPSGSLSSQIAYYVMLTSGVSTVIFNGNPLMRFDGYYILSDWLEIPNLSQRATQLIKNVFLKHLYRVENVRPVTQSRTEWWIMLTYGLLAMVYRLVVFFGILLYLMGLLFGLGVVLAVWSFAAWFLVPTGTFIGWLAGSPQLSDKRTRAVLTSGAILAGLLLLVGAVPLPDWRRTQGVVESRTKVGVFAGADGMIVSAPVAMGQRVKAGEVVLVVQNAELDAMLAQARAEHEEYSVRLRDARANQEPAALQVVERQLESLTTAIAQLEQRKNELTVRAAADGVLVNGDPAHMVGMWVKRGQTVGEIVDTGALRVHALMAQGDVDRLFGKADAGAAADAGDAPKDFTVEFRLASDVARVVDGGTVHAVPSGQKVVPHAALMYAGGGQIEPDTDAQGRPTGARAGGSACISIRLRVCWPRRGRCRASACTCGSRCRASRWRGRCSIA
ncbi:MAG: hypothetical protein QM783_17410 [Phycisphaerales bacterium]